MCGGLVSLVDNNCRFETDVKKHVKECRDLTVKNGREVTIFPLFLKIKFLVSRRINVLFAGNIFLNRIKIIEFQYLFSVFLSIIISIAITCFTVRLSMTFPK